ncbi:MAG: hypothetical protein JXQ23_04740 [Clostridia bacterium]|nr:hypothetical protein [Clostridia bacterium]
MMIIKSNRSFSTTIKNSIGVRITISLILIVMGCLSLSSVSGAEEVKGYWYLVDIEKVVPENEITEDSTTKIERQFLYSEGSFNTQYRKTVYDGIHKVYNDEIINTTGTWSAPAEKLGPDDTITLTLTASINEFKRLNTNMSGVSVKAYIGEEDTPFGRLNSTNGDLVDANGDNLCEATIRDGEIKVGSSSKSVEGTFGKGSAEGQVKVLFVSVRSDKLGGAKYTYTWILDKPDTTSSENADRFPSKVTGTLYFDSAKKRPVPFTSVSVVYQNSKEDTIGESAAVFTDQNGKFDITLSTIPNQAENLKLAVEYIYAPGGIATIYHINVREDNKHVYGTLSLKNISSDEKEAVFDLCLLDCADNFDEDLDDVEPKVSHNAEVYALLIDMYDFYADELGVLSFYQLPFEAYSFGGTLLSTFAEKFDAYYSPVDGAIWLDRIYSPMTGYMYPYAYYHEFSHYIMHCLYGKFPLSDADVNHGGYANPTTGDSFSEGFAHFMSIVMQQYFGNESPAIIPGRGNIEVNYKAWQQSGKAEEFAIAGVLWDLVDDASDNGGMDDDSMELDFMELWNLLKQYHSDFTSFYETLIKTYPSLKPAIDDIFINHGFFTDDREGSKEYELGEAYVDNIKNNHRDESENYVDYSNNDSYGYPYMTYENGDQIGTAAYFSNMKRRSQEFFPGNFIKVNDDSLLYAVSVSFSDYPFLDYTTKTISIDGLVYVEVPPPEYRCTISIVPEGGRKNASFSFESDDFWSQYIGSLEKGYYLSHEFDVKKENSSTVLIVSGLVVVMVMGIIMLIIKKRKP